MSFHLIHKIYCCCLLLFCSCNGSTQNNNATSVHENKAGSFYNGDPKGHLILCGGVGFPKEAIDKFVKFAGGQNAPIVFIASASTSIRLDNGYVYDIPVTETDSAKILRASFETQLKKVFGVTNLVVIDTRDKSIANSSTHLALIKKASGIWLGPGNAGRYADTFLGTDFEKELKDVLARGGVIAGNSAGAIIQGSYTVRGRSDKPLLMAAGHETGFGFLQNVAIDPHLTSAKREAELVNVLDKYPYLLGIGIDEEITVVFSGDVFEILGKGIVAIYDDQKHGNNWYYTLKPGVKFDIRKRETL